MDMRLYPPWWKYFSYWIRFSRAKGRCECKGECGLHRDNPGPRRCVEVYGTKAKWSKGKVVLSVAHLDHNPTEWDQKIMEKRCKAMCSRCHLRYDSKHHQKNARKTRDRKRGQLTLLKD